MCTIAGYAGHRHAAPRLYRWQVDLNIQTKRAKIACNKAILALKFLLFGLILLNP